MLHENKLLWSGTNKFWSRFVKFELVLVENKDLPWYRRSPQIEQIEAKLEQIGCITVVVIVASANCAKSRPKKFPSQMEMFSDMCLGRRLFLFWRVSFSFLSVLENPLYSNFRKWNWHFWKSLLNFWKARLRFVNWRFRDFFENWIYRQCKTNNSLLSQNLTTFSISTVLEVAKPVL